MLSLLEAKNKFFEATKPDRLLMEEHEKRLGRSIVYAIEEGQPSCFHEVPWLVHGPWPLFDVNEVTMELLQHARHMGYKAKLVQLEPNVIEVWGWAPQPKQQQREAAEPQHHTSSNTTRKRRVPKKPTNNFTVGDAKRGVLSSRLRNRIATLKK